MEKVIKFFKNQIKKTKRRFFTGLLLRAFLLMLIANLGHLLLSREIDITDGMEFLAYYLLLMFAIVSDFLLFLFCFMVDSSLPPEDTPEIKKKKNLLLKQKEIRYCSHCGSEVKPELVDIEKFDRKTGKRQYVIRYRCPKYRENAIPPSSHDNYVIQQVITL